MTCREGICGARALLAAVLPTILLILLLSASPTRAAEPLRGAALIIGNGAYAHLPSLTNPEGDSRAIEDLLSELGFETTRVTDRDTRRLSRDIERFIEDANDADVAIVYYSGHGIEAGGENFIVPVDADLSALKAAGERLIPVSSFLGRLQATVPVTILMLDACRDNPFPAGATVRLDAGSEALPVGAAGLGQTRGAVPLATTSSGEALGTVLAFAAEPGRVALDGDPGANSPYAAAILRHMSAMVGEEFGTVMRMVAEEVYLKTAGRQRPWVNESLRRLLYFGEVPAGPRGDEGDILSERRQLLLTIADLPDFERRQVERVAVDGGVPMDAVYGMLKAMGTDVPDDPAKLEELLRDETARFAAVLAERQAILSPDPEIGRLTALADEAEREGLLAVANDFRERAKARFRELEGTLEAQQAALDQRFVEGAAVFARGAGTKALAFDHLGAAADYAEAFRLVEGRDDRLAWTYKNAEMIALTNHGIYGGDNAALERAIDAGRHLARLADGLADHESLGWTQITLGNAIQALGGRERTTARLLEAVTAYRAALREWDRDRSPSLWAVGQSSLANSLAMIGERDRNWMLLEEAVAAYHATLEVRRRNQKPLEWAATQNNLGNTLKAIGDLRGSVEQIGEAIAAYESALKEWTRDRVPNDWALAQNNLGSALYALGERTGDMATLERAISTFRSALEERTADRFPLQWAATQNNLGAALYAAGRRDRNKEYVAEAVAAFRAALTLRTRQHAPRDWALTQDNLLKALRHLSTEDRDGGWREQLVAAYREALQEPPQTGLLDWSGIKSRLAHELVSIGLQEGKVQYLDEGARAFREALDQTSRERSPTRWSATQHLLGGALYLLGEKANDTGLLRQSVDASLATLEAVQRESDPLLWARTQSNLARALSLLGLRENDPALYEQAATAYRAALEVLTLESGPFTWNTSNWATAQLGLARALYQAAQHTSGEESIPLLEGAIRARRDAQLAYTRENDPARWASQQNSIGYALTLIGEREDNLARFQDAISLLREGLAVEQGLKSASAHYTADSLCRALLNMGERKRDRDVLLEAQSLCEASFDAFTISGDPAASESAASLRRIEAALQTLN